jgi:hypothetical protein
MNRKGIGFTFERERPTLGHLSSHPSHQVASCSQTYLYLSLLLCEYRRLRQLRPTSRSPTALFRSLGEILGNEQEKSSEMNCFEIDRAWNKRGCGVNQSRNGADSCFSNLALRAAKQKRALML